jgi:hypothetical protein
MNEGCYGVRLVEHVVEDTQESEEPQEPQKPREETDYDTEPIFPREAVVARLPYTHLIGWMNLPRRVARWFTDRKITDEAGHEALRVVLGPCTELGPRHEQEWRVLQDESILPIVRDNLKTFDKPDWLRLDAQTID